MAFVVQPPDEGSQVTEWQERVRKVSEAADAKDERHLEEVAQAQRDTAAWAELEHELAVFGRAFLSAAGAQAATSTDATLEVPLLGGGGGGGRGGGGTRAVVTNGGIAYRYPVGP